MMWRLYWGWNDTMESRQVRAQEMTCAYKDARETKHFSKFYNVTASSISTTALFKLLSGVNLILEKPPCVKHGQFRANPNNQKRWLWLLLGLHPVAQASLLLLLRTFLGELEDCVEKPEMVGICFLKRVSMSDSRLTTDVLAVSRESSRDTPHQSHWWRVNSVEHSPQQPQQPQQSSGNNIFSASTLIPYPTTSKLL